MRVWHPIPAMCLDNKALLGEHKEIHAIWNIITKGMKGYSNHPETKRWVRYLDALFWRHLMITNEMSLRGMNHKSPVGSISMLKKKHNEVDWPDPIEPVEVMRKKLIDKIKERTK